MYVLAFSMKTLEDMISNKDKYRGILEKTNEALLTYVEELKKMKRFLLDSTTTPNSNGDIEAEE